VAGRPFDRSRAPDVRSGGRRAGRSTPPRPSIRQERTLRPQRQARSGLSSRCPYE
jgi:hypothetical protein